MKIALIQPYFGKFPNYFQLHLKTIERNPCITWIFYTDDHTRYNYPNNCQVHYCEFQDIRERIQSKFDFPIALDKPYKLCDYKPCYGYIFEDDLQGYDYWGHCDVDVLFGDIGSVVTDEVLSNHDFFFRTGHFRLYRNIEKLNMFFKNENLMFDYREVFTHDEIYSFDEMNSFQRELIKSGFRYYENDNIEADTNPFCGGIKLREVSDKRRNYQVYRTVRNYDNQIFVWESGRLFRYYIDNDSVKKDKFMDIHFLKRSMEVIGNINEECSRIVITPSKLIIDDSRIIDERLIVKLSDNQYCAMQPENKYLKMLKFLKMNKTEKKIKINKYLWNVKHRKDGRI
jgi:hypothetical protein